MFNLLYVLHNYMVKCSYGMKFIKVIRDDFGELNDEFI